MALNLNLAGASLGQPNTNPNTIGETLAGGTARAANQPVDSYTGVSGRVYRSDHKLSPTERSQIDQFDQQFYQVGESGRVYKVNSQRLANSQGLSKDERTQIDQYDRDVEMPRRTGTPAPDRQPANQPPVHTLPAYNPNLPDWQQPALSVAVGKGLKAKKTVNTTPSVQDILKQQSLQGRLETIGKESYLYSNQGPEAAYNNAVPVKDNIATGIRSATPAELVPLTPEQQAQLKSDQDAFNAQWLKEHPGSMTDVQRAVAGAEEATQRLGDAIKEPISRALQSGLLPIPKIPKEIADQVPYIISRIVTTPVHAAAEAVTLGSSEATIGQKAGAAANLALDPLAVPGAHDVLEPFLKATANFLKVGDTAKFDKALSDLGMHENARRGLIDQIQKAGYEVKGYTPEGKPIIRVPAPEQPSLKAKKQFQKPPEVTNASQNDQAATLHGNVSERPGQGNGQVPTESGGGGVRPQPQEVQGQAGQADVANIPRPTEAVQSDIDALKRSIREANNRGVDIAGPAKQAKLAELQSELTDSKAYEKSRIVPEQGQGTALANDVTNIVRRRIGEAPFAKVAPETVEQWVKGAVEKGYTEPDKAHSIAKDILEGTKKHLDDEETIGLATAVDKLQSQFEEVSQSYLKTAEKGGDIELASRLDDIRQKINDITTAGNHAGTEWGRSGVARQAIMKADNSFAGMLARRQKIAERDLTSSEISQVKAQADELQKIIDAKNARIAELEAQQVAKPAQETLNTHAAESGGSKPSADKIAKVDRKIKDVSDRLKTKWAESKPTAGPRASLFGADIAVEQAARVAKIAPEILELAKLHVEKGAIKLTDNVKAVVEHLKTLGIDDVSENDVAGVLAGRIKGEVEATAPTNYQSLRNEASQIFSKAAEDRKQQAAFIEQRAREVKETAQKAQRKSDLLKLQEERDQLAAESKAAKEAEDAFWKDVREKQRGFDKNAREAAALDRKEAINRWKASVQGKRAQSLNGIDNLQTKLDYFDQTGQMLGSKSKLPEPHDDILHGLQIREASLRNQIDQANKQLAAKAEFDRLSPKMQFVKKWNPWNVARSVVASFDDSFPLNQGAMALFSDPKSWAKGFKTSLRAVSEQGFDKVMAEIRADPKLYDRAVSANLFEAGANIQDVFGGDHLISKIPGIKQSEQMYEAGANALRFDLFNRWVDMAERSSNRALTLDDYKALAKEVKTWTGQGDWGKGAQAFSKPFFALRYRMSQFETAFGAPLVRTFIHGTKTGQWAPFKVMAAKYAQAAATMLGTVVVADQAIRNLGPKNADGSPQYYIELRRTATDFGRLVHKVGNTTQTWDILPPAVRAYGLMSRVISGHRVTAFGSEQDVSQFQNKNIRTEMVGEYATNGLHPVPAAIWSYIQGQSSKDKKYFGKSQDFSDPQAYKDLGLSYTPIAVQSLKELWENPDLSIFEKLVSTPLIPFVSSNVRAKN